MEEVENHHKNNDTWMIIYDKVYDFTEFMAKVIFLFELAYV
jgi:cytochrome b involved in lipid metabolism